MKLFERLFKKKDTLDREFETMMKNAGWDDFGRAASARMDAVNDFRNHDAHNEINDICNKVFADGYDSYSYDYVQETYLHELIALVEGMTIPEIDKNLRAIYDAGVENRKLNERFDAVIKSEKGWCETLMN